MLQLLRKRLVVPKRESQEVQYKPKNNIDMLLLYVWIYIVPYFALAVNMSHQKPRQV
jgi:hypothetical protein